MMGRGIATAHRGKKQKEERLIPQICFDYCFLRNRPNALVMVVLTGRDRSTGCYINHAVPCKGAEYDWVAKQVAKDIRRLGHYGRVCLKSDGEGL